MNKTMRENASYNATARITGKEGSFGLRKYGEEGYFRSSYEHAFAVYLKELGIKYEFEPYGAQIVNATDIKLHYIPDFFLPDYKAYIEIVNAMSGARQGVYQEATDRGEVLLESYQQPA